MAASRRPLLFAALSLSLNLSTVSGQTPPRRLEPPVKTVELTLASAKPVYGGLRYVRSGAEPTHYRHGTTRDLSAVTWKPFTEGAVTKVINGGITEFHGVAPYFLAPGQTFIGIAPGCSGGGLFMEGYLQFRFRVLHLNQTLVSAVKGDTACVIP